jgi:hypothetical protein
MKFTLCLGLLVTIASLSGNAGAELYSWKDKNGKTIFSDRPPIDGQQLEQGDEAPGKDDPLRALAREEARKKKAEETQRKAVAWRCNELAEQQALAQKKYDELVKADPKKAAVLKTDIDNYADTRKRMCE